MGGAGMGGAGDRPRVALVVGSDSDLPLMKEAYDLLTAWGVGCRVLVASAHRTPDEVASFARGARDRGFEVIIACAGLAAHLPGVIAAHTTLPVIGVPRAAGGLGGLDALLSIVQMPPGVPVASVGLDGARNAALLAAAILAVKDDGVRQRLESFRREQAAAVREKNARLADLGMAPAGGELPAGPGVGSPRGEAPGGSGVGLAGVMG
ncbi:MAG: 5-(carboxyamino)imidazole ribonucleotide mutase [Bacillota bacterium]|nr:5-(carboxyamino)imidazole ribonucleotide mutase [Bacillota bacterium]